MSRKNRNKNNDANKLVDSQDNPLSKKVDAVDTTSVFTEKKNEKLSEDLDVIGNIMIL